MSQRHFFTRWRPARRAPTAISSLTLVAVVAIAVSGLPPSAAQADPDVAPWGVSQDQVGVQSVLPGYVSGGVGAMRDYTLEGLTATDKENQDFLVTSTTYDNGRIFYRSVRRVGGSDYVGENPGWREVPGGGRSGYKPAVAQGPSGQRWTVVVGVDAQVYFQASSFGSGSWTGFWSGAGWLLHLGAGPDHHTHRRVGGVPRPDRRLPHVPALQQRRRVGPHVDDRLRPGDPVGRRRRWRIHGYHGGLADAVRGERQDEQQNHVPDDHPRGGLAGDPGWWAERLHPAVAGNVIENRRNLYVVVQGVGGGAYFYQS